jgi:hypothetical protein
VSKVVRSIIYLLLYCNPAAFHAAQTLGPHETLVARIHSFHTRPTRRIVPDPAIFESAYGIRINWHAAYFHGPPSAATMFACSLAIVRPLYNSLRYLWRRLPPPLPPLRLSFALTHINSIMQNEWPAPTVSYEELKPRIEAYNNSPVSCA